MRRCEGAKGGCRVGLWSWRAWRTASGHDQGRGQARLQAEGSRRQPSPKKPKAGGAQEGAGRQVRRQRTADGRRALDLVTLQHSGPGDSRSRATRQQLTTVLTDPKGGGTLLTASVLPQVPWDDLRYLFGEIMYGGHITDDWDRRLCRTYLAEYVRAEMLEGEILLAPGFQIPPNLDYKVRGALARGHELGLGRDSSRGWCRPGQLRGQPGVTNGASVTEQEAGQQRQDRLDTASGAGVWTWSVQPRGAAREPGGSAQRASRGRNILVTRAGQQTRVPACTACSPATPSQGYHEYIDENLPPESPYLYGLHPNAEIGFLTVTSEKLFRTVLEMQPKETDSGAGTGVSREEKAGALTPGPGQRVGPGTWVEKCTPRNRGGAASWLTGPGGLPGRHPPLPRASRLAASNLAQRACAQAQMQHDSPSPGA